MQVPEPQAKLTSALASLRHTFVVADATLPDCPLVYASEGCALCLEYYDSIASVGAVLLLWH